MDAGNIRTLFLVDGFCFEITIQDIFLIIGDSSMIRMVIVFLHYYRAQPLFGHVTLNPFYVAGRPAVIKGTAYFNCSIPLL